MVRSFFFSLVILICSSMHAVGEPSTFFNIFVPPNNDPVQRNAALIVTAIFDSTYVEIIDDDFDGDNDDNWSGYLNAGQSYILYIKDNGINDDAKYASGGVWKQDGDYFIITSNNLVYASQSTNSDWQHDWLPSTDKKSIGERFILYSPPTSYSKRDVNVFAYQDSTQVIIKDVTVSSPVINLTTFTQVNMESNNIVANFMLNVGEDIIHKFDYGRDLLENGHTYVIESNHPITTQYGALHVNARDGGGYVPSSNGSSSGELFYFAVPYQSSKEQEIRIASWDSTNNVQLDRYSNGNWINITSWNLNKLETGDWVGRDNNQTYPTVFRVTCTSGKKVSVFEANWMETGSPGTSDMATMLSGESGTTSGTEFIAYMAPPGYENRVLDPFTGSNFNGAYTHLYIFAKEASVVTVTDVGSNGNVINRTYNVSDTGYVDCALSLNEWRSIYNGDGNPNSGSERPYLKVTSDKPISVMNTNFNDNWMMYFGSSLEQSFDQTGQVDNDQAIPGDTIEIINEIDFKNTDIITDTEIEIEVSSAGKISSSTFTNLTTSNTVYGQITEEDEKSKVLFSGVGALDSTNDYQVKTKIEMRVLHNNGQPVKDGDIVSVRTKLTGKANGTPQQSVVSVGVENKSANTSNLIFTQDSTSIITLPIENNWTANWVDIDGDNDDDLYVNSYDVGVTSRLYRNEGSGNWTEINNKLTYDPGGAVVAAFADVDNDGDRDGWIGVNGGFPSLFYKNNGNGNFTKVNSDESIDSVGYHHGVSFADYDNDGYLDIFICDFFPTKHNQLHHNNGDGTFTRVYNQPMVNDVGRAIGASWCDFDNDGDQDLYLPLGNGEQNKFYENIGGGDFILRDDLLICEDSTNSVASAWGDYDNDGWMDLYVSNSSNNHNCMFHNEGDGTFTKINHMSPVIEGGNSHGCSWADIDNDGDLDLFVTNDQGNEKYLYMNDGNGNFTRNKKELLVGARFNTYGHYWSDFDQDGDLDIYMTSNINNPLSMEPVTVESRNVFFTNNGNNNNWIEIKLIGSNSNSSAIGSRVKVCADGLCQIREVNCQSGFGGQSSLTQHFGLGTRTNIDSVIISWPSGFKQVESNLSINTFHSILEESSAKISGVAYVDENGNCTYDQGEELIANRKINVVPGNRIVATNENGYYETRVSNGSYNIKSVGGGWWAKQCDWNIPFTVSSATDDQTYNFAFSSIAQGADLVSEGAHTALRKGFKNDFVISLKNQGTVKAKDNLVYTLEMPSEVIILESEPSYNIKVNDTYTWYLDSMEQGSNKEIIITDSVSTAATIGDTVLIRGTLSSNETELDTTDNIMNLREAVVGPIDPNDLLASPLGVGPKHLIKKEQWITYKVRFQNVGNYPAYYVNVIDKIEYPLDINSFEFISSSHLCQTSIDGDKLKFSFSGINLPDSTSDEAGSHGYILFKLKAIDEVKGSSTINNSVEIQFDYEIPIVTNNVFHTIISEDTEQQPLTLIPNPANQFTLICCEECNKNSMIEIYNMDGRKINLEKTYSELGITLNVNNLTPGIYLISVRINDQIKTGKLVVNENLNSISR